MTDKLHMDTDEAYFVVNELNKYLNESESLFEKYFIAEYNKKVTETTWKASSRISFEADCESKEHRFKYQKEILESLISDLQKEIRQWEETSQRLGG